MGNEIRWRRKINIVVSQTQLRTFYWFCSRLASYLPTFCLISIVSWWFCDMQRSKNIQRYSIFFDTYLKLILVLCIHLKQHHTQDRSKKIFFSSKSTIISFQYYYFYFFQVMCDEIVDILRRFQHLATSSELLNITM